MNIDALLSPLELPALARRDLSGTACVVFDILRATSSFVTALHNGAAAIIPVSEIPEAIARRRQQPEVLLAGERGGVRISTIHAGGVNFDFGNSPHEFTPDKVRGKTIVSTTTNGTRALRACAGAPTVLAASFLNLGATAIHLQKLAPAKIVLVCAGTGTGMALEDVLAAGALGELLTGDFSDAAATARQAYLAVCTDLHAAVAGSQNARRLLALMDLQADVKFCVLRDVFNIAVAMTPDGSLQRVA